MKFSCPHCHGNIEADAEFYNMRVACPHCTQIICVPDSKALVTSTNASSPTQINNTTAQKLSRKWKQLRSKFYTYSIKQLIFSMRIRGIASLGIILLMFASFLIAAKKSKESKENYAKYRDYKNSIDTAERTLEEIKKLWYSIPHESIGSFQYISPDLDPTLSRNHPRNRIAECASQIRFYNRTKARVCDSGSGLADIIENDSERIDFLRNHQKLKLWISFNPAEPYETMREINEGIESLNDMAEVLSNGVAGYSY